MPWQYMYWGENMKTHTRWYQYVNNLQISCNVMNMVLKCMIPKGYVISI